MVAAAEQGVVEAVDFAAVEVSAAHSAVEGVAAPFEAADMAEVSGADMAEAFGEDSAVTAGMVDGDEDIGVDGVAGASVLVLVGPTLMDIPTTDIPPITPIPVTTDTILMRMAVTTPMDHMHRIRLLPHLTAEL